MLLKSKVSPPRAYWCRPEVGTRRETLAWTLACWPFSSCWKWRLVGLQLWSWATLETVSNPRQEAALWPRLLILLRVDLKSSSCSSSRWVSFPSFPLRLFYIWVQHDLSVFSLSRPFGRRNKTQDTVAWAPAMAALSSPPWNRGVLTQDRAGGLPAGGHSYKGGRWPAFMSGSSFPILSLKFCGFFVKSITIYQNVSTTTRQICEIG